jgi:hypothetical protein
MSQLLAYYLLSFVILAMCAFAFWKGGPAERAGAVVILVMMVLERALHVLPDGWWPILSLCGDGLTALGLLAVALRYASLWLGGAMLFYAAQFSLHSFYLVTGRSSDTPLHIFLNDFNFIAIIVCLVAGTIIAWRGRIAQAREAARAASETA